MNDLPYVDEHELTISAAPPAVWRSLIAQVGGVDSPWVRGYARLVGALPGRRDGLLPAQGATVPGFSVADAVPERRLVLTGRHRFSRYALVFDLTPVAAATALRARTYAKFPGVLGRAYRTVVIDSRIHGAVMRRMLGAIGQRASG